MDNTPKNDSIDFRIKAAWLAIARMYNEVGSHFGLTQSVGYVLTNIDKQHGSQATKIAPLLGMEARSLTRLLKTMEDDGLISRSADADDKRKTIITLTSKGLEQRKIARFTVKSFNELIQGSITESQLKSFYQVMDKVSVVVNQVTEGKAKLGK